MKAKLVKYPYDEKKYRWDTWYQGKEFEYFWDESLPNNFETIEPYFKADYVNTSSNHNYGYVNLTGEPNEDEGYSGLKQVDYIDIGNQRVSSTSCGGDFYLRPNVDVTNKFDTSLRLAVFEAQPYEGVANTLKIVPCKTILSQNYQYLPGNPISAKAEGLFRYCYWSAGPGYQEHYTVDIIGDHFQNGVVEGYTFYNDTNRTLSLEEDDRDYIIERLSQKWGWDETKVSIDTWYSARSFTNYLFVYYDANDLPDFSIGNNRQIKVKYDNTNQQIVLDANGNIEFYDGTGSYSWKTFTYINTYIPFRESFNNSEKIFGFAKNINYQNYSKIKDVVINSSHLYGLPLTLFNYIYQNNNEKTNNYIIKYIVENTDLLNKNVWFLAKNDMTSIDYGVLRENNNIYITAKNNDFINSYDIVYHSFQNKYQDLFNIDSSFCFNPFSKITNINNNNSTALIPFHNQSTRTLIDNKYYYSALKVSTSTNPAQSHPYGEYFVRPVYATDTVNQTSYGPTDDLNWREQGSVAYAYYSKSFYLGGYPVDCFEFEDNKAFLNLIIYGTPSVNDYKIQRIQAYNSLINVNANYKRVLVDIDEWTGVLNNLPINYAAVSKENLSNNDIIIKPTVCLIGDETDNNILVEDGDGVLQYTLGEGINRSFVPKTLQINAPCEYDSSGNVTSRTWFTFNKYTAQEWLNGFHFEGEQWNNIGSPFAYLNGITSSTGNRRMVYTFSDADLGMYVNVFSVVDGGFEVSDSLGNDYIDNEDELEDYRHYYDDNVGSLWYFGTGEVSSTDRHAYPDEGSQNYHTYILRPEDTTFLHYYRIRDELYNVELFSDRYHYTHDTIDFCDRSYEGTVCGTSSSTGEENIPDGTWREYLGLYLGESIPFLGITEADIPPSEILGVPQYDKQVNTSDTLKYGTVASASLSFTLNKPVNDCLTLNNQLLVLFYDFKNTDEWERLGFFRVDNIEALDEYSTSLLAHDETYKLNKYVDDFLEGYTQSTTLDLFYRDLLDYCGCFYDTHQDIIHNGNINMTNVYHAVKTTGVQVAHYIAILAPGFIHANIDGDIVLSQYQIADNNLTTSDYSNLVYCAYNTDMINKIKITSNNAVKGESAGNGENVYFLADDPLLSELQMTSYFNDLADGILAYYTTIPAYRPATIDFFILPRGLAIGDIVNLTTPKNENYSVIIMRMSITSAGIQVQSFGTQKYPVEAESNSEFVNLINDMGEISGDVSNMMEAQRTMANAIADNTENINQNATDISTIITKNTEQDTTLSNHSTAITGLQGTVGGYKSTTANNLATIILSNTLDNIALKGYVDAGNTSTLNSAKAYADSLVGTSITMKFGTFRWSTVSGTNPKSVHCMFIGTNNKRNGIFIPTAFVDGDYNKTYLFRVYNGSYYKLYDDGTTYSDVGWFEIGNVSFTED